jgi:DNA-binding CsgD family transcriptional regulator
MSDLISDAHQVILKIYEGVIDLDELPTLAETLVRLGGGHTGGLVARRSADSVSLFSQMGYNLDPGSQKAWIKNFANISPLLPLERRALPGDVITASNVIASDTYKRSVYYNEWARKRDHYDYIGIILHKENTAMDYFAILRPHAAGLVTPFEVKQMKVIAPHIKRAYLLSNLLNEYKSQVDSLGSMIMNAGFGVVLATPDCQIVYANDLAETLMRLRRGLCCRQGRISATDGKTTQKLQALISAASLPITEPLSGGSMILPDQDGEGSFVVHVVPVSRKTCNRFISRERLVAGVFIVDRNRGAADRVNAFAPLFGLTPAETRVLAALISGEGLTSAVNRLAMTEPTARTHLKHILAKTDTHRQAELMRLVFELTIPCEGSGPPPARGSPAAPAGFLPVRPSSRISSVPSPLR